MKVEILGLQLHLHVADPVRNGSIHRKAYQAQSGQGPRICLAPELSLFGYPGQDLIFDRDYLRAVWQEAKDLIQEFSREHKELVLGFGLPLPLGELHWLEEFAGSSHHQVVNDFLESVHSNKSPQWTNAYLFVQDGKILYRINKKFLPNYDVFDESRVFVPGELSAPIELMGGKFGVAICEDYWNDASLHELRDRWEGVRLDAIINISASPFSRKKHAVRLAVHRPIALEFQCPLIYINQVAAHEELLYDGASFVLSDRGDCLLRAPVFASATLLIDLDLLVNQQRTCSVSLLLMDHLSSGVPASVTTGMSAPVLNEEISYIYDAIVFGIREYALRSGVPRFILGLSGGIDSAVVLGLAHEALGAEALHGIYMPGPYSSDQSARLARDCAAALGVRFSTVSIADSFDREIARFRSCGWPLHSITQENIQSRLRGLTLMTAANDFHALVLCTTNKSEAAVGYGTQYGDLLGALAPIGDCYKCDVMDLAHEINRRAGQEVIASEIIFRSPSAELKPNQKDEDSLPPYVWLDAFLQWFVEDRFFGAYEFLLETDREREWAKDVIHRFERAEFKRRQAPPILRVTEKAFGLGRRESILRGLRNQSVTSSGTK